MPNRRLLKNNYYLFDINIVTLCWEFTRRILLLLLVKNTNKNTRHLSPHTEVDHISSYIKENTADPMMTSGSIESLWYVLSNSIRVTGVNTPGITFITYWMCRHVFLLAIGSVASFFLTQISRQFLEGLAWYLNLCTCCVGLFVFF